MTTWQARRLAVGEAVVWRPDGTAGVVEWTGGGRLCVRWSDGFPTVASLWHDASDYWHHVGRAADVPPPETGDSRLTLTPSQQGREDLRARIRAAAAGD